MLFGFSPAQPKKITARYFAPTFDVRRSTFDVHDGRYGIACVLGGLVRKFSLPGAVWSTL
ncbi:MAG: hypothetical protein IIC46_02135 [Planctomycetes bacterium]|nr:hypothetical protein [Planctomycetota bacterium]